MKEAHRSTQKIQLFLNGQTTAVLHLPKSKTNQTKFFHETTTIFNYSIMNRLQEFIRMNKSDKFMMANNFELTSIL